MRVFRVFNGALNQIRTGDLVLTKDALCRLSYKSKCVFGGYSVVGAIGSARLTKDALCHLSYKSIIEKSFDLFVKMATRNGLEPSTSSVTG